MKTKKGSLIFPSFHLSSFFYNCHSTSFLRSLPSSLLQVPSAPCVAPRVVRLPASSSTVCVCGHAQHTYSPLCAFFFIFFFSFLSHPTTDSSLGRSLGGAGGKQLTSWKDSKRSKKGQKHHNTGQRTCGTALVLLVRACHQQC